jgi:hypothetical protein
MVDRESIHNQPSTPTPSNRFQSRIPDAAIQFGRPFGQIVGCVEVFVIPA